MRFIYYLMLFIFVSVIGTVFGSESCRVNGREVSCGTSICTSCCRSMHQQVDCNSGTCVCRTAFESRRKRRRIFQ
ncbi:unnamed protein product [Acanthoscelides obtectus]|uniref:Uncharacterized protein n=1 Tax=Acanthoscelides obtectus TaxID=200917 RepID=A0A9P0NW97_ACAOB|nr:unnamed protein product [Acanthoscelides obtectus]CAK1672949.1 hypothetical protein AOBTE_LOCUS29152 [Acanthoscelides obtectus]